MERIPEIERPACNNCKRTMYWSRMKQDWTCEACDDYYFNINAPWDDEDYWDDEDNYGEDDFEDFDGDDGVFEPGYDDYHGPIIG